MKKGSLIKSFKYAILGIISNLKTERNLRIHFLITTLVIILGFVLNISVFEWMICLLLFGLIISLELANTAIEKTCDLVTLEKNSNIKFIKDTMAASVLMSAIISVIIGLLIFIPKL